MWHHFYEKFKTLSALWCFLLNIQEWLGIRIYIDECYCTRNIMIRDIFSVNDLKFQFYLLVCHLHLQINCPFIYIKYIMFDNVSDFWFLLVAAVACVCNTLRSVYVDHFVLAPNIIETINSKTRLIYYYVTTK